MRKRVGSPRAAKMAASVPTVRCGSASARVRATAAASHSVRSSAAASASDLNTCVTMQLYDTPPPQRRQWPECPRLRPIGAPPLGPPASSRLSFACRAAQRVPAILGNPPSRIMREDVRAGMEATMDDHDDAVAWVRERFDDPTYYR